MEVARAHGVPHSVFLSWPQHDQDIALALHRVEAEEKARTCPVCGGDADECQNPDYQRAYAAAFSRCYRTRTVGHAMKSRRDDGPDAKALVVSTTFHPERVKHKT